MKISISALLFIVVAGPLHAQEATPEYHDKPFAVLISRVTAQQMIAYARSLGEELNVGTKAMEWYDRQDEEIKGTPSSVSKPINGQLFFLQKAMMPSVAAVSFHEVADEAEFKKFVKTQGGKPQEEDGKYKASTSFTSRVAIPEVTEAAGEDSSNTTETVEAENSVTISIGSSKGVDVNVQEIGDSKIIEEDGKKFREVVTNIERYFQYHDQLVFEGNSEAAWNISVPNRGAVLKDASPTVDLGAEVYLERIPMGLKSLGWSMLYGATSTEMQQRDEEPEVDYQFRSASGRLALAVAKAGIFDSDHVSGAIEFATESHPILAHLAIDARGESDLAKRLADLSSGESRFAPIINDNAAVTLHSCVHLPEEALEILRTGGKLLKEELIQSAGTDVDLVISGAEIAQSLGEIADQTNLEVFLKLGWSPTSGGALYGGIRVGDNPELLQSVLTLLTPESATQDIVDRFDLTKRGGLDVIEFLIPQDEDDESPFHLSHLYIAHAHSCLWLCVGGENSYEILKQSIARCESAGMRTSTRVLSAEIDLQAWLSYPEDDTGLTTLPRFLDQQFAKGLASGVAVEIEDGNLMQRVIDLGGRQDIRIHLDASKSGLRLSTEIGKAFGTYLAARYMQLAEGAVSNLEIEQSDGPTTTAKPGSD